MDRERDVNWREREHVEEGEWEDWGNLPPIYMVQWSGRLRLSFFFGGWDCVTRSVIRLGCYLYLSILSLSLMRRWLLPFFIRVYFFWKINKIILLWRCLQNGMPLCAGYRLQINITLPCLALVGRLLTCHQVFYFILIALSFGSRYYIRWYF